MDTIGPTHLIAVGVVQLIRWAVETTEYVIMSFLTLTHPYLLWFILALLFSAMVPVLVTMIWKDSPVWTKRHGFMLIAILSLGNAHGFLTAVLIETRRSPCDFVAEWILAAVLSSIVFIAAYRQNQCVSPIILATGTASYLWTRIFFAVKGDALHVLTCPAVLLRLTPQAIFMALNTVMTGMTWLTGRGEILIPLSAWHLANCILLVFLDPVRSYWVALLPTVAYFLAVLSCF